MRFADDPATQLAQGDQFFFDTLESFGLFATSCAMALPEDPKAWQRFDDPPASQPIGALSLRAQGLTSVLWAMGYGFDLGWIGLDVLDAEGAPTQRRGVTSVPGLYFLGLEWQSYLGSARVTGVGADAMSIAGLIVAVLTPAA